MHSHQNTLLSRLGFQDPDRRLPEHDAACRYLAQNQVAERFVDHVVGKLEYPVAVKINSRTGLHSDICPAPKRNVKVRTATETPIVKDRGYIVGFLDVEMIRAGEAKYGKRSIERRVDDVIDYGIRLGPEPEVCWTGHYRSGAGVEFVIGKCRKFIPHDLYQEKCDVNRVVVEVKAGKVNVSESIRQIRFYSEHIRNVTWVLVPLKGISSNEKSQLERERIKVVTLGADFQRFLESEKRPAETEVFG